MRTQRLRPQFVPIIESPVARPSHAKVTRSTCSSSVRAPMNPTNSCTDRIVAMILQHGDHRIVAGIRRAFRIRHDILGVELTRFETIEADLFGRNGKRRIVYLSAMSAPRFFRGSISNMIGSARLATLR